MVSASVIADKYAHAAFASAKKHNLVDRFLADLSSFTQNFSAEFIKKTSSPVISKSDLGKLIAEICKKLSLDQKTTNFLVTIAKARRIKLINQIYQKFSTLVKLEKNILEVEVISTNELDSKQLEEIKTILQKKYTGKTVQIIQKLDKNILGGVVIQVGSLMIDASVKNQLAQITAEFQSIIK